MAKYKNLTFGGGGAKALVYLGVLEVLEEEGIMAGIDNISGSSAGGLFAMFSSFGFKQHEIRQELLNIGFDFRQLEPDIESRTRNFFELKGLYTYDKLADFVSQSLDDKVTHLGFDRNITFSQLHQLHQNYPDCYKDLTLTGAAYRENTVEYFDHIHFPDMKVIDALRITISFPFVWAPIQYNDVSYVDGGIMDNIPFSVFDGPQYNHYNQEHNPDTLIAMVENSASAGMDSLYIKMVLKAFDEMDEDLLEYYLNASNPYTGSLYYRDFIDYLLTIENVWTDQIFPDALKEQTILTDVKGQTNTLDFSMDEQKMDALKQLGYEATQNFLHDLHEYGLLG